MRPRLKRPGRRETGIVVATIVFASWSVAAGQRGAGVPPQPATGNHAVSGRVVDADSSRPIAGASVVVERSGSFQPVPHRPTTSDADGRFTVAGLPGGSFTLVATADGYARGFSSGVALATGTPSGGQREGQVISGVEIRMWRAGAIAGKVTNSDGAPIANATIEARQRSPRGRRALTRLDGRVGDRRGAGERC